ncbi:hypothetical protein OAO87_02850 [bacterium]|nr:hypothetical protein [bacterium]
MQQAAMLEASYAEAVARGLAEESAAEEAVARAREGASELSELEVTTSAVPSVVPIDPMIQQMEAAWSSLSVHEGGPTERELAEFDAVTRGAGNHHGHCHRSAACAATAQLPALPPLSCLRCHRSAACAATAQLAALLLRCSCAAADPWVGRLHRCGKG